MKINTEMAVRIERERSFLKKWTSNGKKVVASVDGSNFYSAGGNRKRCTKLMPEDITMLVEAGLLVAVQGGFKFNG